MRSHILLFSVVAALYAGVFLTCTTVYAQSYEEQAKTILALFESGRKDTAYIMLEPLKRSARFVPAVLYTRAQMTPDDRALALYKEVIALAPDGPWAERAAFQLVSRYVEKRDSLAAYTWAGVLNGNYSRSTLLPAAAGLLKSVDAWRPFDEEPSDAPKKTATKDEKGDVEKGGATVVVARTEAVVTKADTTSDTYKSSGMKGYALQVGVFSTRDLADARSVELKKKNIRSVSLPKMVNGKKQYALVVGPYSSIEEANRKKAVVAGACECDAFIVKVQ